MMYDEATEKIIADLARSYRVAAAAIRDSIETLQWSQEALSWPIYLDERGGVMCGQPEDVCSLDAENSVILAPWDPNDEWPKFTASQLIDAIQEHIETDKAYKLEKEEG